jgi:hypothetical protein
MCGCVDVWMCGCVDVWMCGCVARLHICDCVCGDGCVVVDVALYVRLYMCGCEIAVATAAIKLRQQFFSKS